MWTCACPILSYLLCMSDIHAKRFQYEKLAKLDSPERRLRQPVAPLYEDHYVLSGVKDEA